ncbi:EamA-like transporter family protein [Roseovarius nanhaiticus]|uniref:EamA-like transporter family protein n=1 Tax=Roseovarius nanhaiticus TaxID=573024 RepID=A0A1N7EZW6_9RHOB|nr:DMT family transporter [Roseovarius nanhaiticus]SEK63803.1 EamA-like transporter family protein [Roseovarius nanhaiticus]SIR93607.1 EamA-like transporter family protein [Roseovarius nanhaiticus]
MSDAWRGHLAMLAFSGLIAGSFAMGSLAAPHIAPAAMNAMRFSMAAVVLGIWTCLRIGVTRRDVEAPWRYLLLGGLLSCYFVLMFEALKTAPAVSLSAVFTLSPILSGIAGYLLLRQVMTPRMGAALAVGAAGALWVIFRADLHTLLQFRMGAGEALFFWGCTAHAIYTPLVRRLNRGQSATVMSFGTIAAAALIMTGLGAQDLAAMAWGEVPLIVWITLAYITVFATALTIVLLQYASLKLPSAKVMAYTYLLPTWVIGWQAALSQPLPPALVLVGVALTITALVMLLKNEEAPAR